MRYLPLFSALAVVVGVIVVVASLPDLRASVGDHLMTPAPPPGGSGIVITKSTNRLYLYRNSRVVRRYEVSTGKEPHYTPEGVFTIVNATDEPGDDCYGPRWLGLGVPSEDDRRDPPHDPRAPAGLKYGLHGTDRPDSIGGFHSGGCVRLRNEDITELYDLVGLGTTVEIRR